MVMVSTIIPTRNRPHLLMGRAIPSVLCQTIGDWECIVVGDDTDDVTVDAMTVLCRHDRRFRFVNLPRQVYPGDPEGRWMVAGTAAFNHGLDIATGRWVSYLADDDCYLPRHHSLLLAKSRGVDLVYGQSLAANNIRYGTRLPLEPYDVVQGAYIIRRSVVGRAIVWPSGRSWDAQWWIDILARGISHARADGIVHEYHPSPDTVHYHNGVPW